MSAIILCFPGFLLADDRKGFWKDGRYHASVDALMASLSEIERYRCSIGIGDASPKPSAVEVGTAEATPPNG
jgi:hypothetical protein